MYACMTRSARTHTQIPSWMHHHGLTGIFFIIFLTTYTWSMVVFSYLVITCMTAFPQRVWTRASLKLLLSLAVCTDECYETDVHTAAAHTRTHMCMYTICKEKDTVGVTEFVHPRPPRAGTGNSTSSELSCSCQSSGYTFGYISILTVKQFLYTTIDL